jgi:hypothetical protein
MSSTPSKVPVLFIISNCPEAVRERMQPIRRYRPERLYIAVAVAAGGGCVDASALGDQARTATLAKGAVDWPCDVHILFCEQNADGENGASQAIAWMRKNEKYGAIVTDDDVVSDDFLRFCEKRQSLIHNY